MKKIKNIFSNIKSWKIKLPFSLFVDLAFLIYDIVLAVKATKIKNKKRTILHTISAVLGVIFVWKKIDKAFAPDEVEEVTAEDLTEDI